MSSHNAWKWCLSVLIVCNKCVCALGEAFEDDAGVLVNGCVVSVRPRGDRVSIWVGHKTEELLVTQIG